MSPSLAHMREPVPRACGAHIIRHIRPVEVENDQEDFVGERVDRHTACITPNSDSFTLALQKKKTYVDVA
jgi:hypothetical protein